MSGFITTMCVLPTSHVTSYASPSSPPFPTKPKPLQPVFTFAQSQSCMNLAMNIPDHTDKGMTHKSCAGVSVDIMDVFPMPSALLVPAKPQTVYTSPLQRAGKILWKQQAAVQTSLLTVGNTVAGSLPVGPSNPAVLFASAQDRLKVQFQDQQKLHPSYPNYSYKLVAGGRGTSTHLDALRDGHGSSGEGLTVWSGSGTVSSSETNIQDARHDAKLQSISLLSSFYSNPRTQRAPFKAQKSGRGTSSWQLKQYAEATLGSGSLRKAVKLPEGEDKDEWLAVNGLREPHLEKSRADGQQWSTSTTRSTFFTAPSPSSAHRRVVPR